LDAPEVHLSFFLCLFFSETSMPYVGFKTPVTEAVWAFKEFFDETIIFLQLWGSF